jgi:hypothetical protein
VTTTAERSATLLRSEVAGREVFGAEDFGRLVDTVLMDGGGVVQRAVYAQDITGRHLRGWVPETVLVVTTCDEWGALYFRDPQGIWISHNTQPSPDSPELVFDDQAPASFPPSAVIPMDEIRAAVQEYLDTGQRPTHLSWRESDRAMVW